MKTDFTILSTTVRYLSWVKQNGNRLPALCTFFALFFFAFTPLKLFGQGKGSTAAGFEVDANFISNNIPSFWKFTAPNQTYFPGQVFGDDWSKGTVGNAVLKQELGVSVPGITADRKSIWQIDGNYGNASTIPELSTFSGSSNKNGDPIGAGQSPYNIEAGGSGPQKNDITNVFLHTRRATNGHLWLFYGAETRTVNGSSYLDLEYNQAGVTTTGGQMVGLGPVNGRTIDDIILIVNYTKGGKEPIVSVRKWLPTGTWSDKIPLSATGQYITTNTVDIDAVAPGAGFTGDGGASNTTIAFQFVEGGIDITALGVSGVEQCTPDATLTIKTRSSSSYTSELKDWDIVRFPLTPTAAATVADITAQCRDLSGTNVFSVSGTYDNGTPAWSTSAGSLSNQVYAGGTATATLTLTDPTSSADVTLTTTSPNINCPAAMASKTATINENPTVDQPGDQVLCNGEMTSAVNFTGSVGASFTWTNNETSIGLAASGTGDIGAFTATNTGSTAVTATIEVTPHSTDNGLTCDGVAKTFTITVNPTPVVNQPGDQVVCNGEMTTAISFSGTGATSYSWTNDETSIGLAASGTGDIAAFTATNNGTSALTATIEVTPHYTGGGVTCDGASKSFTIIVNPTPAVDQPGNQVVCDGDMTTAVNFTGTAATSFTWTNDQTSIGLAASGTGDIAAFTATNNAASPVTATIEVTPHYTGDGVTCDGASKSFTIIVNPTPTVDLPSDQVVCNGTNTTAINFTGAGVTSFTWTNDNISIGLAASGTGDIAAFTGTNAGASPEMANVKVTPHYSGGGITCDGPSKTFTITVNPNAAPPLVTYIPPTCTESSFSVEVTNPQVGSTYMLSQMDGNMVDIGPYVSGQLIFTGLHIGEGYSIYATTGEGCTSNPEECGTFSPAAPATTTRTAPTTTNISIQMPAAKKAVVTAAPNPYSDRIRFVVKVPETGRGSLDLYNLVGQKVQTVYEGNFEKGSVRTFNYEVPYAQRSNLIYVLRIADQKVSGTLIGMRK